MSALEPPLPLGFLRARLLIALEQVRGCVEDWSTNFRKATTISHPGLVTPDMLRDQPGMAPRSIISVLGGKNERISGGSKTLFYASFVWFIVTRGVLKDRTEDGVLIAGEGVRFVTDPPWLDLEEAKASGLVAVTGTPGSPIGAGELLTRAGDNPLKYTVDVATVIGVGGDALVQVSAVDAGYHSNARKATRLTFDTPPAGVDPTGQANDDGITGGSYESAFAKTPIAESVEMRARYSDKDERTGISFWTIQWRQALDLGTARRPQLPYTPLRLIEGTDTIAGTPNPDHIETKVELPP